MWVNIEDTIHFGFRAAIASIGVRDFVNNTGRHGREFFELLKNGISPEIIEGELREVLLKMYPQSKDWTLLQCGFNPARQSIDVVVSHNSFSPTPLGCELVRLVPGEHCD